MTAFEPVFLPEGRGLNRRARQTFLRHFSQCPRSAFLSQRFNGEAQTAEMVRGSAMHEIARRATAEIIERGETEIPPDVAKSITDEVLGEMHVPWHEHDFLRECTWRWASEFTCDPSMVVALETLFVMDVAGWQVRARVDFAELLDQGRRLKISDWKTSKAAPPYEEIARKTADGRLVPRSLQLVLYALALVYGYPVREEDGVEVPEPFSVAPQAREFDLEFAFPGIEDREGRMVRRPLVLNHLELEEYRSSLEGLVQRVERSEETGDWPAIVSDAACSECPAPEECPIPREVRGFRGMVNTPEDASAAASLLDRQKAELRAAQTELRNFAKATGDPIRFGDKVWELVYSEYESIDDKEGLLEAVDRAVMFGEPFDRAQFVRVKGRTDFRARDLTAEEREADG